MFNQSVIILYLAITIIIGFWAGKKTKSFEEYAIGKRTMSTFILFSIIIASIIDASETIDYASEVITEGLVYCSLAFLGSAFASAFLAFFVAPKFGKFLGRAVSTGDIVEKIFGLRAKTIVGVAILLECVLFCGVQILAISITIQYFFGISGQITSVLISVITILYFFRGGARSVNATDIFQFGILVVALPIFCGFAVSQIGGFSSVWVFIKSNSLNFAASQPVSLNKSLIIFILFALPGQYPLMIQRMLMAKNTKILKKALILDAVFTTLIRVLIIIIGIAALILLPSHNPDLTMLEIANDILPNGIKGLAVVGLLAILMSTIDSTIHLGSVALIQDIIGSTTNKITDERSKLRYARFSSILIIGGAIIASLSFNSIGDLYYLLIALGNSLLWPGLFLGITGISSSKKGFWVGVSSGFATATVGLFALNLDPLYLNLYSILTNFSTHILYVLIAEKNTVNTGINLKLFPELNIKEKFSKIIYSVKYVNNYDYCNIFAVLSIILSVYPFFTNENPMIGSTSYAFLTFSGIVGALAVVILFSELWSHKFPRIFLFTWASLVILSLPVQTYFMLFHSGFSIIWVIDAILIIPLVVILSSKTASFLFHLTGGMAAMGAAFLINSSYSEISANFGYWSLFIHILILTICLALFRKRDVEMCRSLAATLVHETNRAITTFEGAALFYQENIPKITSQHGTQKAISQSDVNFMDELPSELLKLGERTRSLLNKYNEKISSYSKGKIFIDNCDISKCIKTAMADISVNNELKKHIFFKPNNNINIKGDRDQLIQVFINILENAGHALAKTKNPKIEIIIIGQSVFISDNGKGISSVDIPSIFDEFFSTKLTSGQGLAFCKRAMIEHSGSIICSSREGKRTKFELRFPANFKENV